MGSKIKEWQAAGFSEKEINEYVSKKTTEWTAADFTQDKINDYLGVKEFDPAPLKQEILSIADRTPEWRQAPNKAESFLQSFLTNLEKAGEGSWNERVAKSQVALEKSERSGMAPSVYERETDTASMFLRGISQHSLPGLIYQDKMPELLPEDLSPAARLSLQAGAFAGNFPVYWMGSKIALARAAVDAGVLMASALRFGGAIGLEEGLRRLYTDKIENGEIHFDGSWTFAKRMGDALLDTVKGLLIGGVTGATGAGEVGIAKMVKTFPMLVGLPAALEGRLPTSEETLTAAVLCVGMELAPQGAKVFREHWARTGEAPSDAASRILTENMTDGRKLPYLKSVEERPQVVGKPTEPVRKPDTFSGEPEPYDGPLTPEQRYRQNAQGARETSTKNMRLQDIVDEQSKKIVPQSEMERVWDLRTELKKVIELGKKMVIEERESIPLTREKKWIKTEEDAWQLEKGYDEWGVPTYSHTIERGSYKRGTGYNLRDEKMKFIQSFRTLKEAKDFVKGPTPTEEVEPSPGDPMGVGEITKPAVVAERGEPTASYAYDWDLGKGPEAYYRVKGGPYNNSDVSGERLAELGIKVVEGKEAGKKSPLDMLTNEDGFIDLEAIIYSLEKVKDLGKFLEKEIPYFASLPFFKGSEWVKDLEGARKKYVNMPYWRARNDLTFRPYYKTENRFDEYKSTLAYEFVTKLDPFFKLRGKDYDDYRRIALEGDKQNVAFESREAYETATGDKISEKAFSVYKLTNELGKESWELRAETIKRTGAEKSDLEELHKELGRLKSYLPRVRKGAYYLLAEKEGEPRVRKHFDNEAQKRKITKELKEEGYAITESGEVGKIPSEMFGKSDVRTIAALLDIATEGWKKEVRKDLFREVSNAIKSQGFSERSIKREREYVKGFEEKNLKKVWLDYYVGLAGSLAKTEKIKAFREQFFTDMSEGKFDNRQKGEVAKYITDMLSPTSPAAALSGKIRALLFLKHMAFSLPSAVVNLSGNAICAFPRLSLETNFATVKLAAAMSDIVNHVTGVGHTKVVEKITGETVDFSPLKTEEIRMLRLATQKSFTQDQYVQELMGTLRTFGSVGNMVGKLAGAPMSISEKWNRASTALAAFRIFRYEKGLDFEIALEKTEEVVYDAHGKYGKSNLPGIFRGSPLADLARSGYTFRVWSHNWLNLVSFLTKEEPLAVLKMLGVIGLIGGMRSLPGYKTAEALLQRNGIDPSSEIKKAGEESGQEDLAIFLLYGLAGDFGVDIGGSVGAELPGQRAVASGDVKDIAAEVALDLLGVPTSVVEDTYRAAEQLYNGDFARAVEESPVTPARVRTFIAATRMEKGGATTREGKPIRDDAGEAVQLSEGAVRRKKLGFQPVELAEGWRTYSARQAEMARWNRKKNDLEIAYTKAYEKTQDLGSEEVMAVVERMADFREDKPAYVSDIDMGALFRSIAPISPSSARRFQLQEEIR